MVNALSKHLEVWVKRGGAEYNIAFANGDKVSELEEVGRVGKANTGTRVVSSGPTPFSSIRPSSACASCATCCAKAVLCRPADPVFRERRGGTRRVVLSGRAARLPDGCTGGSASLPEEPFVGNSSGNDEVCGWAWRVA